MNGTLSQVYVWVSGRGKADPCQAVKNWAGDYSLYSELLGCRLLTNCTVRHIENYPPLNNLTGDPSNLEHLFYENGSSVGTEFEGDSGVFAPGKESCRAYERVNHRLRWLYRSQTNVGNGQLTETQEAEFQPKNGSQVGKSGLSPSILKSIPLKSPTGEVRTHSNVHLVGFSQKGAN